MSVRVARERDETANAREKSAHDKFENANTRHNNTAAQRAGRAGVTQSDTQTHTQWRRGGGWADTPCFGMGMLKRVVEVKGLVLGKLEAVVSLSAKKAQDKQLVHLASENQCWCGWRYGYPKSGLSTDQPCRFPTLPPTDAVFTVLVDPAHILVNTLKGLVRALQCPLASPHGLCTDVNESARNRVFESKQTNKQTSLFCCDTHVMCSRTAWL
jgi:hypothetical protein